MKNGWLVLFLWLGIGVGSIVSVIVGLNAFLHIEGDVNLPFSLIYFTYLSALVVIAVSAIIAFYRGKSNAVALAKTYIAMIVVDGLSSIVVALLCKEVTPAVQALQQFIWAGIWYLFLKKSKAVNELFPVYVRTWNPFEKVVFFLYVLAIGLISASTIYISTNDSPKNLIFTSDYYIDLSLSEVQYQLPITVSQDIICQQVYRDKKVVTITYQLINTYKANLYPEFTIENAMVSKHEVLSSFSTGIDVDPLALHCIKEGYTLNYETYDALSEFLYSVTITPAEYKSAVRTPYKCPTNILTDLIIKYNGQLPTVYLGDASLQQIGLTNNDTELTYTVRFPNLPSDGALPTSYIESYLLENWGGLKDPLIRLAIVNQMDIRFDFLSPTGMDYATILISPETYNAL